MLSAVRPAFERFLESMHNCSAGIGYVCALLLGTALLPREQSRISKACDCCWDSVFDRKSVGFLTSPQSLCTLVQQKCSQGVWPEAMRSSFSALTLRLLLPKIRHHWINKASSLYGRSLGCRSRNFTATSPPLSAICAAIPLNRNRNCLSQLFSPSRVDFHKLLRGSRNPPVVTQSYGRPLATLRYEPYLTEEGEYKIDRSRASSIFGSPR